MLSGPATPVTGRPIRPHGDPCAGNPITGADGMPLTAPSEVGSQGPQSGARRHRSQLTAAPAARKIPLPVEPRHQPRAMIARTLTRPLAAALSVLFLTGISAELYGLRDCPHHSSRPAPPASNPTSGGTADRAASDAAPLQPESHDTCTCLGTCHGGATVPATALTQPTPAVSTDPARRVGRTASPDSAPPRNDTLVLPYPTGPPAPGSPSSA